VTVSIPSPLLSYTRARDVQASGRTLAEVLHDLDRRFPGLRFHVVDDQDRLRGHMRFFVNGEQVFDIDHPLSPSDSVHLVQALSGG